MDAALKMEQYIPKLNAMKLVLEESGLEFADQLVAYSSELKKAGADDRAVRSLIDHLQRQLLDVANSFKPSKLKFKRAITDLEGKLTTLKVQCLSENDEEIQAKHLDNLNKFESTLLTIAEGKLFLLITLCSPVSTRNRTENIRNVREL